MKKFKVRASWEFDFDLDEVSKDWTADDVEFFLNESSHCAQNELADLLERVNKDGCPCLILNFEVIEG